MRVVLVNPPKTQWERDEIAPPLGLLNLAAVAQQVGASVSIEDFNLLYHLLPALRDNFYDTAVERLLHLNADVYGFTSMAVDSHVALEIARRLKHERPDVCTIFGGPHFSSLGDDLSERYPWVGAVVAGQGEGRFGEFLSTLHCPSLSISESLPFAKDRLPPPYTLLPIEAYFHANPRRLFNYEPSRGCKYKCTFCYSPNFYSRMDNFGTEQVLRDLTAIRELGGRRVFFVGDNLLNKRAWVEQLCTALEEARLGLSWYCYATFTDLDEDLAARMARAGCTNVFMGIDTVGRVSERIFHKAFLPRVERDFERKLSALIDSGIRPTCGFILCPPSHPGAGDWDATVAAALRARLVGANILFNVLNLYHGTEAQRAQTGPADPDSLDQ